MVRADALLPETLAEMPRDALGHPPRVDEHERRPVLPNERGDSIVDVCPLLVRGHGLEIGRGKFDREVHVAPVPDVDDRARAIHPRSDEKARGLRNRVDRGRKANSLRSPFRDRVKARKRQREVTSALVAHERVQLVDDDRPNVA